VTSKTPSELTAVPPKTQLANSTAIADTGATGHCLDTAAEPHCIDIRPTNTGPLVQVVDGNSVSTHKRATIPLANELSTQAKQGHIFEHPRSGSLISIGQLCDDDCIALLTKHNVEICKNGQAVISGKRNPSNGLWNIPLAPKAESPLPTPSTTPAKSLANGAIQNLNTEQDLASFLHARAFSPLPSTFLRATQRGHFTSWPGLTPSLIKKHLAKSLATSKGHPRVQQKNIQSTKISSDLPLATSLDIEPSQEPQNASTHVAFASLLSNAATRKSSSDQTGKFPVQSSLVATIAS
jgi:hypothetical protein